MHYCPSLSSHCLTAPVLFARVMASPEYCLAYLGSGTLKVLPWPCCRKHWPLSHSPNPAYPKTSYGATSSSQWSTFLSFLSLSILPPTLGQRSRANFFLSHLALFGFLPLLATLSRRNPPPPGHPLLFALLPKTTGEIWDCLNGLKICLSSAHLLITLRSVWWHLMLRVLEAHYFIS